MLFKERSLLKDGDFILIQSRVGNLELEIEKMKTHINSLRGLVNRKIGSDLDPEKKENLKSVDGLDEIR